MTWVTWIRKPRRLAVLTMLALLGGGVAAPPIASDLGLAGLPGAGDVMSSGLPNDNLVYDRTGTVLVAELQHADYQHSDLPLSAMGRWLPVATLAVEDPGFYREAAAVARITERLVRLRTGSDADTAADRVRRAAVALQVGVRYSHDGILEAYLNSLPYGNRAIGAEAAAITYFQVDASHLDLAQAALLAGLPASPSLLDPLTNLPRARARQRQVLDSMVRTHAISRAQSDQASAEALLLTGPSTLNVAPGFVRMVLGELSRRFGAKAVERGGLSVLSTLDWGLQQDAERDMHLALDANRQRGAQDGALVAMDPRSGQVLAMVDSVDRTIPGGAFDMATAPINPGSTMRTFGYAAAVAGRRYTMVTPVADALRLDLNLPGPAGYRVVNYDGRSHGVCQLRVCLGTALNIPAVEVEMGIGVPEVVRTATALGTPPGNPPARTAGATASENAYGPSLVLGGYPVSLLSLTTGYAALGASGIKRDAEALLRVTASDGGVRFLAGPDSGRPAIDPGAAFIVSQMLADDASRTQQYGTGSPLTLPGRRVAAVEGTSENFRDGLTIGYTPSLAAAVWLGRIDGPVRGVLQGMSIGSDGIVVAAPAWHEFMQDALDQLQKGDEWYSQPSDVESGTVNGGAAWFLRGTSATTPPPLLPSGVHLTGG
jgi:membrane peptidoglycan carboxypeptidase